MPGPIGPDDVRRVAEAALDLPGADGVEVLLMHEWGGLTRFANSSIHQSTWREDTGVRVRVVTEGRIGVVATNAFTAEGARTAAASALEMAQVVAPDAAFAGLAPQTDVPAKEGYDEDTASMTPARRAEAVAGLIGCVDSGFRAAGAFETTAMEVAVANSLGQFCYSPFTQASVSTVVSGGDGGAGTAEATAGRAADVDPEAIGRRAFAKARDSQSPRDLPPGQYEVVLEPLATATLATFLAWLGFGGRSLAEGRSALSGKEGQQVCAPSVSIVDDALSPGSLGPPFDFEGSPKQRITLIDHGVFVGGVHDRRSAKQAGGDAASTGHALPPPNPEGPFPLSLVFEPGQVTVEEMIAGTGRGLLVTRFHYTNVVHPIETVLTGMTRDGTWLIEDGEVAYPVKNLRFTQSILGALSDVRSIGKETELASEFFFAATRVPAIALGSFNFSSASDH
jgi:PmbA protein